MSTTLHKKKNSTRPPPPPTKKKSRLKETHVYKKRIFVENERLTFVSWILDEVIIFNLSKLKYSLVIEI